MQPGQVPAGQQAADQQPHRSGCQTVNQRPAEGGGGGTVAGERLGQGGQRRRDLRHRRRAVDSAAPSRRRPPPSGPARGGEPGRRRAGPACSAGSARRRTTRPSRAERDQQGRLGEQQRRRSRCPGRTRRRAGAAPMTSPEPATATSDHAARGRTGGWSRPAGRSLRAARQSRPARASPPTQTADAEQVAAERGHRGLVVGGAGAVTGSARRHQRDQATGRAARRWRQRAGPGRQQADRGRDAPRVPGPRPRSSSATKATSWVPKSGSVDRLPAASA